MNECRGGAGGVTVRVVGREGLGETEGVVVVMDLSSSVRRLTGEMGR